MRYCRAAILLLSCMAATLFIVVGVLWVRSAWITDQVTHVAVVEPGDPARWRAYKVRSHRGELFASVLECDDDWGIYDSTYLGWRLISERNLRIGLPNRRRNVFDRLGFFAGHEGARRSTRGGSHRFRSSIACC